MASATPRAPRALAKDLIVTETLYIEGVSTDGRDWRDVVRALRSGARRVGASVRVVGTGAMGVRVAVRTTLAALVAWETWGPADLPYDVRSLVFTLRSQVGALAGKTPAEISAMLPGGPLRRAAA